MNDAGHCSSCKWWAPANPDVFTTMGDEFKFQMWDEDDFSEPDREPLKRSEYRVCLLTEHKYETGYAHPESKALSVDGEQYRAQLYTAPDFGCVQWQPRQEDPGKDT